MTFGERLKDARKSMNLTQRQLAEKINAKHNSVSDWENDKNKPDPDTIEILCGVLRITPNYLLGTKIDKEEEITLYERSIIKKYRSLDPHGQETINIAIDRETSRVQQINAAYKSRSSIVAFPTYFMTYYHNLASAGTGEYIFEDLPTANIEVPANELSERADFVIGVNGDSMEPTFFDGDKVYVEKMQVVEIGDIGIFMVNNECFIKEAGEDGLISHNKKYDMISGFKSIQCIGKVLGKVE